MRGIKVQFIASNEERIKTSIHIRKDDTIFHYSETTEGEDEIFETYVLARLTPEALDAINELDAEIGIVTF